MGEPVPGIYANAQCYGTTCVQATPNLSCEYLVGGCQTIVSGFMAEDFERLKQCADGDTKPLPVFTGIPGICLKSIPDEWAKQGVKVGDVLTHIDGEYIGGNLSRAAELSSNLKAGTKLTLWVKGSERKEITL